MRPSFIDQIVVVVREPQGTAQFYGAFLGSPIHQDDESIVYVIGETRLFFVLPHGQFSMLNKDLGGLNHLAFGVRTAEELRALGKVLKEADIKNGGVRMDEYGNKQFIWFDDPDGYRIEFYRRPHETQR